MHRRLFRPPGFCHYGDAASRVRLLRRHRPGAGRSHRRAVESTKLIESAFGTKSLKEDGMAAAVAPYAVLGPAVGRYERFHRKGQGCNRRGEKVDKDWGLMASRSLIYRQSPTASVDA